MYYEIDLKACRNIIVIDIDGGGISACGKTAFRLNGKIVFSAFGDTRDGSHARKSIASHRIIEIYRQVSRRIATGVDQSEFFCRRRRRAQLDLSEIIGATRQKLGRVVIRFQNVGCFFGDFDFEYHVTRYRLVPVFPLHGNVRILPRRCGGVYRHRNGKASVHRQTFDGKRIGNEYRFFLRNIYFQSGNRYLPFILKRKGFRHRPHVVFIHRTEIKLGSVGNGAFSVVDGQFVRLGHDYGNVKTHIDIVTVKGVGLRRINP